jgi:hypothetical protein
MTSARIDFDGIAAAALRCSELIVQRWLPTGKRRGREWVALNDGDGWLVLAFRTERPG